MLNISVGVGRTNPNARVVNLDPTLPSAVALARAIESLDQKVESWWSPHTWKANRRFGPDWIAAVCVPIDLDHENEHKAHVRIPLDVMAEVAQEFTAGKLPGSLYHFTPRGLRVLFVFKEPETNAEAFQAIATAVGAEVRKAFAHWPSLKLDERVLLDRARLLYAPNATVDGAPRMAPVIVMEPDGFDARTLATPRSVVVRRYQVVTERSERYEDAVQRYNTEHERELPDPGRGQCPMCGHKECFGRIPNSTRGMWACYSTNHMKGGRRSDNGSSWFGDFLDIDATAHGTDPITFLRVMTYLPPDGSKPARTMAEVNDDGSTDKEDTISDVGLIPGNFVPGLVDGVYNILNQSESREFVFGAKVAIEFNEQKHRVEVNREPVDDVMVADIRRTCEVDIPRAFPGKCTERKMGKKGKTYEVQHVCLQYTAQMVWDALALIARRWTYHPVRDYLRSLVWDGTPRIEAFVEDVLGAPRTKLNVAMMRKWFIGAVARVMEPGCKFDNVFVLVGPGGIGKSRMFRALAGESFFNDSDMPIGDKDAYSILHNAWIHEWSELDALRGRDATQIKAFLAAQVDRYRKPYERGVTEQKRSCVIVGTTNEEDFLRWSPGGQRRFWIIAVTGPLDVARAAAWRDQLWAEATTYYDAEEPWFLEGEDERALVEVHDELTRSDARDAVVMAYAECNTKSGVSAAAIMEAALDMKMNSPGWKATEQEVYGILKRNGWRSKRTRDIDGKQTRRWFPEIKKEQ